MRKSKFTDSKISEAFRRVEAGLTVPELCHEVGIRTARFYKWRSKFGGMGTSLVARLKELEEANRRVHALLTDRDP